MFKLLFNLQVTIVSLSRRFLENEEVKKCVINRIGLLLRKEIAVLCSDQVPSVLRYKSTATLKSFQWKNLAEGLQANGPILFEI